MKNNNLTTTTILAAKLGFTPQYIRRLILEGKIKAIKIGHDWLIDEKAIRNLRRQRPQKVKENKNEIGKVGSVDND